MIWKHEIRYKDGSTETNSYNMKQVAKKFGDLVWVKWFDGNLTAFNEDRKQYSTWGEVEIDTNDGVKLGEEYFWVEGVE
jgi:hypothetical protein